MNGPHTQAFVKDNRFTRLIERVAQQNAADGKPAGRMLEQMSAALPTIPASRLRGLTPQQIRQLEYIPEMEDPRMAAHAAARAQALGITNEPTQGDDLPAGLGHVASEPTDAEIDAMLTTARGQTIHGAEVAAEGAAAPGPQMGPAATQRAVTLPRGNAPSGLTGSRSMPNFANVEGFDLTRKVAVVDGMEFRLADDDVVQMKKYAIQVVVDNVTYQLAQALVSLGIPQEMAEATAATMRETAAAGATPEGMNGRERSTEGVAEAVQQVQGEEIPRSIPERQRRDKGEEITVSEMSIDLSYLLGSEVPADGETEDQPSEVLTDVSGSGLSTSVSSNDSESSDDSRDILGDGETPS